MGGEPSVSVDRIRREAARGRDRLSRAPETATGASFSGSSGAAFIITIAVYVRLVPDAGPEGERVSRSELWSATLGLLPVLLKKDVPGFVENRVLYALLREVVDLVERGVIEPEDIDTCVSWGIGYKLAVVGPMALLDMAGMDIYHSVSSFLNEDLCDRKDVAPLVSKQMAAGKLGIKSGEGVYSYTPEKIAQLQPERARKLVAIRRILEGKE